MSKSLTTSKKFKNVYSTTLRHMLDTGFGFRNENFRGSNVYSIKDIIEFEILNLNNADILYTLEKMGYNLGVNICNLPDTIEALEQSKKLKLFKNIFGVIEGYFDDEISNLYGIWLTSERCVKKFYCNVSNGQETYNKYNIKNCKVFPISDLMGEGSLLVLKKHPSTLIAETLNYYC